MDQKWNGLTKKQVQYYEAQMIIYQETKLNRPAFELRPLPSKICPQPRLVIGIFRDACRKWHASVRAGV